MTALLKMNLVCPLGHRWFSPDPDAWVGRVCGHSTDARHGCQETLARSRKT